MFHNFPLSVIAFQFQSVSECAGGAVRQVRITASRIKFISDAPYGLDHGAVRAETVTDEFNVGVHGAPVAAVVTLSQTS